MWRERTAIASFLIMESLAWTVLATVLAGGAGAAGPAYPTVLLATLGGFLLVRALQHIDVSRTTLVAAGSAVSMVVLLVLLNVQYNAGGNPFSLAWLGGFVASPDRYLSSRWPQTWGVVVVVAAWFRAVQVAQRDFTYGLVLGSFSAGLGLVVVVLLFGQVSRADDTINAASLPFFVAGLLTLSLVHLRRAGQSDGDFLRGPWLPVMAGTVTFLALVSVLAGLFPLALLNRLLAPVGLLALRLLDLIILLIALPVGWLISQIISRLLGRDFEWPQLNNVASEGAQRVQEPSDPNAFAAVSLLLLKFLFLFLLAAAVAFVLYRVFRRLRRPARTADQIAESVYAEGSLGDDLGALMRGLLGRLRRNGGEREPSLPAGVLRMRRLYVRLLDDAAERGVTRPPPATPHEFSPELQRTFGTPAPEQISDRFAAGRYGRIEPSREELAALEREAARLRKVGPQPTGPHPPSPSPNNGRGG